jgi:hypothetical protein
MPNHKLKRQKKMGETPIILLPVVAPEPHMKSRTPSDSAIVAIFQDKRKPAEGLKHPFPLDFTAIFGPDGGKSALCKVFSAHAGFDCLWISPRILHSDFAA